MCSKHVAARGAFVRAERMGSGRCGCGQRHCPGSEAAVTNSRTAVAVGSSIHAEMFPNCHVSLSNKIPAETQTEIRKECKGKIPKSRLHLSGLG